MSRAARFWRFAPPWYAWLVHVLWVAVLVSITVECATILFPDGYTSYSDGSFNFGLGQRMWLFILLCFFLTPATFIDIAVGVFVWGYYRIREEHLSIGWVIITCMAILVLLLLMVYFVI
jgi:hypothetical protein